MGSFEEAGWCNCAGLAFRRKLLINFWVIVVMGRGAALPVQSLCVSFSYQGAAQQAREAFLLVGSVVTFSVKG